MPRKEQKKVKIREENFSGRDSVILCGGVWISRDRLEILLVTDLRGVRCWLNRQLETIDDQG